MSYVSINTYHMKWSGKLITKGSTDAASIKIIKERLNILVNAKLDTTNPTFGDTTEAAVKAFQKKAQLWDDGKVGELTWERLFTNDVEVKPSSSVLRFRALEIADTQLFVREKTGKNDGVEVEAYLKSVGLGKSYAWCMAFVYWCFLTAANALKVPVLVPKTAGVLDCYAKAKKLGFVITGEPEEGDQFFMDFGKGNGHTGFVTENKGKNVLTCEGNTSAQPNNPNEDREGQGVYERIRSKSSIMGYARYK